MAKRGRRPRKQVVRTSPAPPPTKRPLVWQRVEEFVEGAIAFEMIASGVVWFVEECETEPAFGNARMFDYIRSNVLDSAMMKRYEAKKEVPTVFVAEQWTNDAGEDALLFVEQGPRPRVDPGPQKFPTR